MLALPAIFALARPSIGMSSAVLATALLAFSTIHVFYSRELREYEMRVFLALLVWLCLDRVLSPDATPRSVAAYTLAVCASLLVQFGLLVIVVCTYWIFFLGTLTIRRWANWKWSATSTMRTARMGVGISLTVARPMLAFK